MNSATTLSEPRVLAHTKQALFPDSDDSYVVDGRHTKTLAGW